MNAQLKAVVPDGKKCGSAMQAALPDLHLGMPFCEVGLQCHPAEMSDDMSETEGVRSQSRAPSLRCRR